MLVSARPVSFVTPECEEMFLANLEPDHSFGPITGTRTVSWGMGKRR